MRFREHGDGTPIDHVARRRLPWRDSTLTECGLPLANHPAVSYEDVGARVKKIGAQRAAFTVCMTCWNTATRYDYGERPWRGPEVLTTLAREITWAQHHPDSPLHADLRAISALVGRHRAEFDELIEDQRAIVSIESAKKGRPV